ncbi:MAG: phosphatase PAP2 family protein [Bacteroidota bacterium]
MISYSKILLFLSFIFLSQINLRAQGAHELDGTLDGALLGAGGLTFGLGFHLLKKTKPLTEEEIRLMDPLNVNKLDRPTTKNWDPVAHRISDITLHASFYSQFSLLLDNNSRDEAGTIGVMMAEVALLNNGITNIFKGTVHRKRPFAYNPDDRIPMDKKLHRNAKFSFFSGHASNSASYAFLTAKVFTDNNPNSKWNPYVWSAAVTLPAVTSFLRVKAGKHFPTDVVVGYAVGAAIGFLVPELHKL